MDAKGLEFNTTWRKVASTIYKKPADSKVFGAVEVDVTELERFISEKRKNGLKITLTHMFVLILAKAIKTDIPELNCYVKRGKIIHRDNIDALVSVLQADSGMGSVMVHNADQLNLEQLASVLAGEIRKSRKGDENKSMESKNILARLPWPFRKWLFRFYKTLTIDWGVSVPFLGLNNNSFGSFLLTNIGTLGLDTGYPALMPASNISFVFVLGGVKKKPVVIDDQIVIRRIMSLAIVLDHRLVDASHGGKLLRYIKHMIKHPGEIEGK